MSTIRIDTFRNRVAAVIDLLTRLALEAEDLHVLAYDRQRAAEEVKVSGGGAAVGIDLDTNGDKRARDAYRIISEGTIRSVEDLAVVAHEAITLLRAGNHTGRRHRQSVTALELAEALAVQARRGTQYAAIRALPQPHRDAAVQAAVAAHDQAVLDRQIAEAETASLRLQLEGALAELRSRPRDRSKRCP